MNIKVITRHSPSNYGSLLQSIATIKILECLGHQPEIIDYQRNDERGLRMIKTQVSQKDGYSNPLKRLAYIAVRYPIERLAQSRFDAMRKKYLKMTARCTNEKDLRSLKADAFITGSDQVWGPMMNGVYDSAFFLQFVAPGGKKLSFASSFGKTTFDSRTKGEYIKMLSSYDKIAVREDTAVQLLSNWGLRNCIGQVLDPTLLFSGQDWSDWLISSELQGKYIGRKYILIYQIHNDPNLSSYALKLADKTGLELVRVNPFMHQAKRGGKFICCPDVAEFLALIKNATYMVTDSFHGTCFAVNFNKQFIEILPNNSTGTRNQSILTLTGLSNRIIVDFNDYSIVENVIDYDSVNLILEQERKKSIEILKDLLD